MKIYTFLCSFLAATIPLASLGASSFELYASEAEVPSRLFRVDPYTGQTTLVADSRLSFGLDFRNDGVLYGSTSDLIIVDPLSGLTTVIGDLPDLIVTISFSPFDTLYGVSNDGLTLYELDPRTGTSMRSVPITGTKHLSGNDFPGEISGIEFAPDGTLYGIGFGLYTIDPLNGVATRITPLNESVSGDIYNDLDFGPDGKLRGVTFGFDESPSDLYEIDTALGIGELVGPMGVGIYGLASIPEPSTYALMALGLLGIIFLTQHKKRKSVT